MWFHILLLLSYWKWCNSPCSVSIRYKATEQKLTLQVSCYDQAIIDILKMKKYNLPNGIEKDVTMVSNNIDLSVEFNVSHNSLDVIELYKGEIIKQTLEVMSNHGYKFKCNYLFKKQYSILAYAKNTEECLKRLMTKW